MNQHISHPCDLPPGDGGISSPQVFADVLGGLANDFQIADYTVLNQTRGKKSVFPGLCVLSDALKAIANAFKIETVLVHRPTACCRISERIRE